MKKFLMNGLLFAMIIGGTTLLQAEETVPDDFQLRLGGYLLAGQDTDIGVSKKGGGVNINLQDLFEMETTTQVFRLDGYYRFTPTHAVEFSWYSINNSSQTDTDIDFEWGDKNISASGALSTYFDTDIYKVNYLYSFYHTEKVELGLSAGLHITTLNVGFTGNYTSDGVADNSGEDAEVTAPLPVVGFRLNYNILPELSVKYAVDYFFITFDSTTGSLTDSLLSVDYRITRHFGMGVGFNSTLMRLETDVKDDATLNISHNVVGGLVYGTLNF
ncbi:MAG: hypothetical protein V3S80_06285 [Sulfurimonadaceae bacterium]